MSNDMEGLHPLMALLANPDQRESALHALCNNRDVLPDLVPVLMNPSQFTANPIPQNEVQNRIYVLDALLFLMKSRYNTNLHPAVRRMVIGETNALYTGGLGLNLMKSITDGLVHLKNIDESKSTDICLRKMSECLFFMYYATQIEENEVLGMTNLIKSISDILVDTTTPEVVEEWKTSAFAVLSVLQITHISALDQMNYLLNRHTDDFDTSEDDINALKQTVGSKNGMDLVWRSRGAKGLACLANAVLRQPAVDCNEAPAADVVWFLKEASEMRAYSYIRLCLLPVLLSSNVRDEEHFYISVLCELLRKIAHIFHIYELARHPDRPFFLRSNDLSVARSGRDGSPLIRSDCLDDVMHLFAAVCTVRPTFAEVLRDVDATGASALHPFVVTSLEASDRQPCLVLPSMRLLAGVGSGLNGVTAGATYHFLKGGRHPRLKWDHLFFCVESFAKQMGALPQATGAGATIPSSSTAAVGGVRTSPLNPKDEEGLLAIIELVATCVQDSSIADNLHHKYDPIKKLFSLLACPIPITLKGAIFKALAAFVKGSSAVAKEVWELIEQYRLLPVRMQGGGQQGLRFELENTESRAGMYPSTEGFLQLLDALLCTHDTPDTLGMGYRRPGLMVYLEFALDDVLLRAHERFYAPESTHRGMTQRWRLTARALKVLVSIMQHYAINKLPVAPHSTLPFAVREDSILQGVAADFREEVAVYKMEDLTEQRCSRPKTLGFSLMALMLGRCRLLERVLSLLGECSVSALDAEKILQGAETTKASVEIFATMQPPYRISSGVSGYGSIASQEMIDLEMDLSMLGFNDDAVACDGAYWMEKTVSNCIGLLYECSLRESRFLDLIRSAPPLTIMRSEEGRTAALPVMIQGGLVEALSSSLALGTVAHFMRLPALKWHSIPSVPVMATRLLEHVSVSQASERSMWAMRSTPEEEGYLLSGCVRAIIEGDEKEASAVFREVFPMGADRYPDVFTQSVASSGSSPDVPEVLKLAAEGNIDSMETARGALLCLILKALVLAPGRLSLTHQLLGIRQTIEEGSFGNNLPSLSGLRRNVRDYMPVNCLQAILILIAPSDPVNNTNTLPLIQREPELACICYEIIYHLCVVPLSSAVTLAYLRSSTVQFLKIQVPELINLACMSDSVLQRKEGEAEGTSNIGFIPSQVEVIKAARHSCTAYVLQIFALELRSQESSPNVSALKMRDLLDLLFAGGAPVGYRGAGYSLRSLPIMTLLGMAADLPVLSLPSITSPIIIRSLSAAAVPYSVSRGGRSTITGFSTISISLFTKMVRDEVSAVAIISPAGARASTVVGSAEFEDALKAAVQMNVYNSRAAAAAHLCQAWGQLMDVSVLGCGGALLSASIGDGEREDPSTALRLISAVVLPTLHVLTAAPLETVMAEQLVKSVLSVLSTLRPSNGSEQPAFSPTDCQTLITALIRALLRRTGGCGVPRSSSLLYRGFLYSSITRVLNFSLSSADLSSRDSQGGSEEGKYDARGYRYNNDTMCLEHCSAELVDTLGTDASSGPPVWRVVALSALSSVLTALGPFRDQQITRDRDSRHCRSEDDVYGFPSSSYLQALQALSQRGHLSSMMGCIGASEPGTASDPNLNEPGSQELFESAASLCVVLANSREGGLLLLENGFISRVCALQFFRTPPPSAEEISPFGANGVALREEALRLMEARLAPVLRVMRCLCAVSPSQPVIEGAAQFLQLNHLLITYLLRLRFHTLKGLALAEAVLALMSLVAASSSEGTVKQARLAVDSKPSVTVKEGVVWSMLGSLGDTFVADTCSLLMALGSHPLPSPTNRRGREAEGGWWTRFNPSTPHEEMLQKQLVTPVDRDGRSSNGLVTPPNWTLFDQKKLMLSLRVTSLAAAFLRRRSGTSENSSFSYEGAAEGGLLAVDFDAVAVSFVACAGLCCHKGASSSSSLQWLMSSSSALALIPIDDSSVGGQGLSSAVPTFLYIVENLICVLHNMNAAASSGEKACWAQALHRCVGVAERDFPPHSFVKQVGQWIRDQMGHEDS